MVKEKLEKLEKLEKERPEKERPEKERPKDKNKEEAIKVFVGKDVTITLRGGTKLKGKLEMTTNYELILTINNKPTLVMKHAVDYIELTY